MSDVTAVIRGDSFAVDGTWDHERGGITTEGGGFIEIPFIDATPTPVARFADGQHAYHASPSEQLDGRRVRLALHTMVCEECGHAR